MSRCALKKFSGKAGKYAGFLSFLFASFLVLLLPVGTAQAQRANLVDGAAIVSAFSGLLSTPQPDAVLDAAGISLKIFDLSNPGQVADGSLVSLDELLAIRAEDIGQIFAIAIDQEERPSIFIGATSLGGLYRTPDNGDWDPVMWGRNGGPGTIYRLHPDNGYQPEPFTEIRTGERPNSGAGLGDIVYDPRNRQLIVSDLESGLIYRVNLDTGESVESYDHGIDGRSYFFDADSETYEVLDIAPWNEAAATIMNCGAGPAGMAAQRFMSEPACWGYASYLRRVFALAVNYDAGTGDTRLYYSLWSSTAFGDPTWEAGSGEAQNSIWSVLLDESGAFDLTDVRREIIMPPFYVTRQDRAQFGESQPVASITFAEDGAMVVAERGIPLGYNPDTGGPIVAPASGRVIKFVRNDSGKWVNDSRYDVGFGEREYDDPPHLRAAGTGGVALGYGYTGQGQIDPDTWGATVWISGNVLCGAGMPCGDSDIDGIQGTPTTSNVELAPIASFVPFPSPGPATPATGPNASYFLNFNGPTGFASALGDIAIARTVAAEQLPPPILADVDLALYKRSELSLCQPNGICLFIVEIRNVGSETFTGPLSFVDTINANFRLDTVSPGDWSCVSAGGSYYCQTPEITLLPGQSSEINLSFYIRPGITQSRARNCAIINWPGQDGRGHVLSVQVALLQLGFDPGTPDGISGPRTRRAIRDAEQVYGLPQTGEISPELLDILFGTIGGVSPDTNPENDRDCARVNIDIPPPPAHIAQISAFHRRFQSSAHNPRTSAPIQIHIPAISSFHVRYRSSMHDGVTTRPIPIHRRPLSQFHLTFRSGRHDGFVSSAIPIHNALISTFHNRFNSVVHNILTSNQLPIHRPAISNFHQNWISRWHARATSSHSSGLSQFHGRFNSNQHQPATSNQGPVHLALLSAFHIGNVSRFHSRATSRHNTGLSQFHGRFNSNQHLIGTSNQGPVHLPIISTFHNGNISRFHRRATSRHNTGLSTFHGRFNSNQHLVGSSNQGPVHLPVISNFHNGNVSRFHARATSRHNTGLSTFHGRLNSNLHQRNTSNQGPVHLPILSTFHGRFNSNQHNLPTSRQIPNHNRRISGALQPVPNPNPPAHLRALSRTQNPPVHIPRVSRAQNPVPVPNPPAHLRALSRTQNPPVHIPRVSRAQNPVPVPNPPAHLRAISRAQNQPVHVPRVSRAQNPAPIPDPPAHLRALSRAQNQPVHLPRVSRAQNPVPVPNPPAHLRAISRAQNPPAHLRQLSRAQSPAPAPNVPVHTRRRSQAQQAPTPAPAPPVHSRRNSQAQQVPVPAPNVPVHSRRNSQAQQAPVTPLPLTPAPVTPGRVHAIPMSRQQQAPGSTPLIGGSR